MLDVSPGQMAFHLKSTISLRVRFSAPSRIRTCAHGSGVQSRIQPLPAGTLPAPHARGAYWTREIVVLSFAICRHRLPMIRKAIGGTNDYTCMRRNLGMAVTPGERPW